MGGLEKGDQGRQPAPFMRVVDHFRGRILAGELQPGDRLPSVREIAQEWSLAKATVERVVTTLKQEGLVRTAGRAGTVVVHREELSPRLRATLDDGSTRLESMSATVVPAPGNVARELGLRPAADVVRRRWATYTDARPVSYAETWFAGDLAELDGMLTPSVSPADLIGKLARSAGKVGTHGRDAFSVSAPSAAAAEVLGDGLPSVLLQRSWLYDQDGRVLRYEERSFIDAAEQSYELGEAKPPVTL